MSSNIIVQVQREIARVNALIPKLDPVQRDMAARSIRFAELAMKECAIANLYESLDELKEFKDPNPPAPIVAA